MVLDDKLASLFNWKGQRGNKLKLSGRRITKIMIETVAKEFPTINEIIFGRKAGPWLAQATFRIRIKQNKDESNNVDDLSSESGDEIDEEQDNEDEKQNIYIKT